MEIVRRMKISRIGKHRRRRPICPGGTVRGDAQGAGLDIRRVWVALMPRSSMGYHDLQGEKEKKNVQDAATFRRRFVALRGPSDIDWCDSEA